MKKGDDFAETAAKYSELRRAQMGGDSAFFLRAARNPLETLRQT